MPDVQIAIVEGADAQIAITDESGTQIAVVEDRDTANFTPPTAQFPNS